MSQLRRLLFTTLPHQGAVMLRLWKHRLAGHAADTALPETCSPQIGTERSLISTSPSASTIPASIFDRRPAFRHDTPLGKFFLPEDAVLDSAAQAISAGATVNPEVRQLAEKCIKPGSVVLDIGAGFGQLSILCSRLVGEAGQVLAFEADEYLCDLLQLSIRANRIENIRVFFGAVFDDTSAAAVFTQQEQTEFPQYGTQQIAPAPAGPQTLPTLTIDELGIRAPVCFMRIDTPGCGLHVLRGAANTIAKFRMPISIEFDETLAAAFGVTHDDLMDFLQSIRYYVVSRQGASNYCLAPEATAQAPDAGPAGENAPASAAARPCIVAWRPPYLNSVCKLLKNRQQIDECTQFLKRNGFVSHNISCKDWDLAHIVPAIGDGHFLDMGSSDSYILKNLSLERIRGEKYGIDLRPPDVWVSDVKYLVGDLMHTGLPGQHFSNIACLSVLEHQIDFGNFAREAARLLTVGGRLFVTFDYWEPKVISPIKLYGLDWQPLDASALREFITVCAGFGLRMISDFDFESGAPVIQWGYYSPHPDMSYTFGMAVFQKS